MTNTVVFIADAASGSYTMMNRTKVPMIAYIGPFKDEQQAINYLARTTNFDKGSEVPEGYALVKVYEPLLQWNDLPDPVPWQFNLSRQQRFDLAMRPKTAKVKTTKISPTKRRRKK